LLLHKHSQLLWWFFVASQKFPTLEMILCSFTNLPNSCNDSLFLHTNLRNSCDDSLFLHKPSNSCDDSCSISSKKEQLKLRNSPLPNCVNENPKTTQSRKLRFSSSRTFRPSFRTRFWFHRHAMLHGFKF
jgi:hypothetical protein